MEQYNYGKYSYNNNVLAFITSIDQWTDGPSFLWFVPQGRVMCTTTMLAVLEDLTALINLCTP